PRRVRTRHALGDDHVVDDDVLDAGLGHEHAYDLDPVAALRVDRWRRAYQDAGALIVGDLEQGHARQLLGAAHTGGKRDLLLVVLVGPLVDAPDVHRTGHETGGACRRDGESTEAHLGRGPVPCAVGKSKAWVRAWGGRATA